MRTEILIIDPQMDFCDHPSRMGSLAVPGAHKDMLRVAGLINALGPRLADIHVTLDSHHALDIAHPGWWTDEFGASPSPFTIIKSADMRSGKWRPRVREYEARCQEYLDELATQGKYDLCIWPEHCLIGSPGNAIHPELFESITKWERANLAVARMVTKGSNPFTEHYSGLKAEVPDPMDEGTQLNTGLIEALAQADEILIAGEALSHCVASTVRDIAANFDQSALGKLVLLRDGCSSVPGFEAQGEAFVKEMQGLGVRVMNCADYQPVAKSRARAGKAMSA